MGLKTLAVLCSIGGVAIGAVTSIASAGSFYKGSLDGKADAADVQQLRIDVASMKTARDDDRERFARMEQKLDQLLARGR